MFNTHNSRHPTYLNLLILWLLQLEGLFQGWYARIPCRVVAMIDISRALKAAANQCFRGTFINLIKLKNASNTKGIGWAELTQGETTAQHVGPTVASGSIVASVGS